MRFPVHTTLSPSRPAGAPAVLVGSQRLPIGSYRPPVLTSAYVPDSWPPQTTMKEPVQTVFWSLRNDGAPTCETGLQESRAGLYRPAVSAVGSPQGVPPQTIISFPVQAADWTLLEG